MPTREPQDSKLPILVRRLGALLSRPAKSAITKIGDNPAMTLGPLIGAAMSINSIVNSCQSSKPIYSGMESINSGRMAQAIQPTTKFSDSKPSIKFFVSIPKNEEEFQNVFGRPATKSDLTNLKNDLTATTKLSGAEYLKSGPSFIQSLKEEKSSLIIVIGHNEAGLFFFPDGSSADFSEIVDIYKKRFIFISCKAQKYMPVGHFGTASNLTYKEAISIGMDLQEFYLTPIARRKFQVNTLRPYDLEEEITSILSHSERSAKIAYNVKQIAINGLPAAATGVVIISKAIASNQLIPQIKKVMLNGSALIVIGENFDQHAMILLDGKQVIAQRDKKRPVTILICNNASQMIAPNQSIKLKVQNSDGNLSNEFSFTRPP